MEKVSWNEVGVAEFKYSIAGPIANHNYLCAVCRENKAVLDLNTGILQPCWKCQRCHWVIKKTNWLDRVIRGLK